MTWTPLPPRYVLAGGADTVASSTSPPTGLVDRSGGFSLLTDATGATQPIRSGGGHVHVYDSESAARAALAPARPGW
jgi:hypothetical protein